MNQKFLRLTFMTVIKSFNEITCIEFIFLDILSVLDSFCETSNFGRYSIFPISHLKKFRQHLTTAVSGAKMKAF